ncbi:MAG: YlxR family protein [Acidimicrobiales bacterium]
MGPPQRTCIGCRRLASPDELMRVVAGPDGDLVPGRGIPGRGAWLCKGSVRCIDAASRRKAFSRALRTEISAPAVAALRSTIADRARMDGSEPSRPPAR